MSLPVALTSGEPAGIGLEVTGKAWMALRGDPAFFLIADITHVKAALGTEVPVQVISSALQANEVFKSALPVLHHEFPVANVAGSPDPKNAASVIAVIEQAVALVQSGQAAAICTNPIHKAALVNGAAFAYPGHTEFLAALGSVKRPVMMLAAPELRVVPVTIHIALAEVPKILTGELLRDTLIITHRALENDFGIKSPRLAVAGLNPHAGEDGVMGREEIELITPVLQQLTDQGMDITGPMSADTMFHAPMRATYDVALCMYHDQALIPLKTLNFNGGVNITLGLPFVRTSPDHGTALNIAGRGIADTESLIAAITQAHSLASNRANQT